jgi:hypothetical protein
MTNHSPRLTESESRILHTKLIVQLADNSIVSADLAQFVAKIDGIRKLGKDMRQTQQINDFIYDLLCVAFVTSTKEWRARLQNIAASIDEELVMEKLKNNV